MEETFFPEFDPGAPWIGPPGEEQRAPGAEITPPGPEITPPGQEFGQGGGEAAPQSPRKRSKRYLAAVAAVLLGLLGAGRTDGQPGPALETRPPVQTEATEPSAGPTEEPTAPPLQTEPAAPAPPLQTEAPTQPPVQAEAVHVSVYPGYLLPGQEQEVQLLCQSLLPLLGPVQLLPGQVVHLRVGEHGLRLLPGAVGPAKCLIRPNHRGQLLLLPGQIPQTSGVCVHLRLG